MSFNSFGFEIFALGTSNTNCKGASQAYTNTLNELLAQGGFYKNTEDGIATVKQAKTGKWYITIDGDLVQGVWLNTQEEAMKKANEYVEYL
jgi:hypothetical protein